MEQILTPNNDGIFQTITVTQSDNVQTLSVDQRDNTQDISVNADVEFLRGYSPTIDIDEVEDGYNITVTDINHTETVLIPSGGDMDAINEAMQNAVLKTPQEFTDEELNQVRSNIRIIGKSTEGMTFTPYETYEDDEGVKHTPLEPVVAGFGAEIYNDYENNIASGLYSIAEGYMAQATGPYSHAEGWMCRATGIASIASGLLALCSGNYAHAEGTRTKATRNDAHAEGDTTSATANCAHTEGMGSIGSSNLAHAEGWGTTASNIAAHAEGEFTVAKGRSSLAAGVYTIASTKGQAVFGSYNKADSVSAFIVGNGGGESSRANAFTISKSGGNGWFAGTVEATALILKSSSGKRFKITVDDSGTLSTTAL